MTKVSFRNLFGFLCLLLFLSTSFAAENRVPVITTDDVAIDDPVLEQKLMVALKKVGKLTSVRQGTDSYMVAVLCEYPDSESGSSKVKPSCSFRKIKMSTPKAH